MRVDKWLPTLDMRPPRARWMLDRRHPPPQLCYGPLGLAALPSPQGGGRAGLGSGGVELSISWV